MSWSRASLQTICYFPQEQIAERVAKGVVDDFKAVKVKEQNCNFVLPTTTTGKGLIQAILEESPVGQSRKNIVVSEEFDPVFGNFAVRDVFKGPFVKHNLAIAVTDGPHIRQDPLFRAISTVNFHFRTAHYTIRVQQALEFTDLPGIGKELRNQIRDFPHELRRRIIAVYVCERAVDV